jgi:hypothetical protein
LKSTREKGQVTCKSKSIRITDFLSETLKARRAWSDVFQALKEYNCQPRLLYPVKLLMENARGVAHVAEGLPSKHTALSSNPVP